MKSTGGVIISVIMSLNYSLIIEYLNVFIFIGLFEL